VLIAVKRTGGRRNRLHTLLLKKRKLLRVAGSLGLEVIGVGEIPAGLPVIPSASSHYQDYALAGMGRSRMVTRLTEPLRLHLGILLVFRLDRLLKGDVDKEGILLYTHYLKI